MNIHGNFDFADRHRIYGWCRDDDDRDQPVSVVVTVNGAFVTRVLSNAFRPDLVSQGAAGHLSFDVTFQTPLSPLVRFVVEVRGEVDGTPLCGSPIVIEPAARFDADVRHALAGAVGALETEAEAEDRLGFLAEQIDGVLAAKARLRSNTNEREARRRRQWRQGQPTDDLGMPHEPRALVIGTEMPGRDTGGILSHLRSLVRIGYAVSFVPSDLDRHAADPGLDAITILTRPWYGSVEEVLASHFDGFDIVYLHRSRITATYAPLVRVHQPSARLIFAVADLDSVRLLRQAGTANLPDVVAQSRHEATLEQRAYEWCDAAITDSRVEAAILRDRVWTDKVHIVPFSVQERDVRMPFASRAGLAFIGDYAQATNVDAAFWLAETIMPAVVEHDPSIKCLLVGAAMPAQVRALSSATVFPLGSLDDPSTILDSVRLTVALGVGSADGRAGILRSLAAGVPCVCTPAVADGLDLPNPLDALVASDFEDIVRLIVRLHDDEVFHSQSAAAGRSYFVARASDDVADTALRSALAW